MRTFKLIILLLLTAVFQWSCSPLSSIQKAASIGDERLIEEYIEKGADVNERDESNYTPLMLAVSSKNYKAVDVLLENGANINDQNIYGETALSIAAGSGCSMCANVLLSEGADKRIANNKGEIPLDIARKKGEIAEEEIVSSYSKVSKETISSYLAYRDIFGYLFDYGKMDSISKRWLRPVFYGEASKDSLNYLVKMHIESPDKNRNVNMRYAITIDGRQRLYKSSDSIPSLVQSDPFSESHDVYLSEGFKHIIRIEFSGRVEIEKNDNIVNVVNDIIVQIPVSSKSIETIELIPQEEKTYLLEISAVFFGNSKLVNYGRTYKYPIGAKAGTTIVKIIEQGKQDSRVVAETNGILQFGGTAGRFFEDFYP